MIDLRIQKKNTQYVGKDYEGYKILEFISGGVFCDFFIAADQNSNQFLLRIIPQIKVESLSPIRLEKWMIQKEITPKIIHENKLRKLKNVTQDGVIIEVYEFFEKQHLYDYIYNVNKGIFIKESEAIFLVFQVVNVFRSLQWYRLIHRDLKLTNFLVKDSKIKLTDQEGQSYALENSKDYAGTPQYLSPEMLETYLSQSNIMYNSKNNNLKNPKVIEPKYDSKTDIFSLGCIFYEIQYKHKLLKIKPDSKVTWWQELKNLYSTIQLVDNSKFFPKFQNISNTSKDLIRKMTNPISKHRISWDEIFEHKLFKSHKSGLIFQKALKENMQVDFIDLTFAGNISDLHLKMTDFPENIPQDHKIKIKNYYSSKYLDSSLIKAEQKDFKKLSDLIENNIKKTIVKSKHEELNMTEYEIFTVICGNNNFSYRDDYLIFGAKKQVNVVFIEFLNESQYVLNYHYVKDYKERQYVFTLQPDEKKIVLSPLNQIWEIFGSMQHADSIPENRLIVSYTTPIEFNYNFENNMIQIKIDKNLEVFIEVIENKVSLEYTQDKNKLQDSDASEENAALNPNRILQSIIKEESVTEEFSEKDIISTVSDLDESFVKSEIMQFSVNKIIHISALEPDYSKIATTFNNDTDTKLNIEDSLLKFELSKTFTNFTSSNDNKKVSSKLSNEDTKSQATQLQQKSQAKLFKSDHDVKDKFSYKSDILTFPTIKSVPENNKEVKTIESINFADKKLIDENLKLKQQIQKVTDINKVLYKNLDEKSEEIQKLKKKLKFCEAHVKNYLDNVGKNNNEFIDNIIKQIRTEDKIKQLEKKIEESMNNDD